MSWYVKRYRDKNIIIFFATFSTATHESKKWEKKMAFRESYALSNQLREFETTAESEGERGRGYPCGTASSTSLPSEQLVPFRSRMATAVCGRQAVGSSSKAAKTQREQRRKSRDSKRRQAAVLFLSNISLDGRPQCPLNDDDAARKAAEEQPPPPRSSPTESRRPPEPAPSAGSSSSSFPGGFAPSVGANEVFLEGGAAAESPESPPPLLLPLTSAQQPCVSRGRSATAGSPLPAGQSRDSRPRLVPRRRPSGAFPRCVAKMETRRLRCRG